MSSKFKVFTIALIALFAIGFYTATSKAEVTGFFSTHISIHPQTTATEIELIEFDIENNLTVTVAISGLNTTLHAHFGIAGVEDVQLTLAATLGALDISSQLVFGRFAAACAVAVGPNCLVISNVTTPASATLRFIKKRVTVNASLGGVTINNLAIFEDTNIGSTAPWPTATAFAFGDVFTLSGSTPSGISVSAQTGICAQRAPNVIKKHAFPFTVNPDCATTPKPDILFDFERITVSGVVLSPGVTASATISCVTVTACSLTQTISFAGPLPFTASFTFTDLLSLSFGGATLNFTAGGCTLRLSITTTGTVGATRILCSLVLNPGASEAGLDIDATIVPGTGLTSATVGLSVERSGLEFGATASFAGGPPATFSDVTFTLGTTAGVIEVDTSATFTTTGLDSADVDLTVRF